MFLNDIVGCTIGIELSVKGVGSRLGEHNVEYMYDRLRSGYSSTVCFWLDFVLREASDTDTQEEVMGRIVSLNLY